MTAHRLGSVPEQLHSPGAIRSFSFQLLGHDYLAACRAAEATVRPHKGPTSRRSVLLLIVSFLFLPFPYLPSSCVPSEPFDTMAGMDHIPSMRARWDENFNSLYKPEVCALFELSWSSFIQV